MGIPNVPQICGIFDILRNQAFARTLWSYMYFWRFLAIFGDFNNTCSNIINLIVFTFHFCLKIFLIMTCKPTICISVCRKGQEAKHLCPKYRCQNFYFYFCFFYCWVQYSVLLKGQKNHQLQQYFRLNAQANYDTPRTRGGQGGLDRTLAVKRRKNTENQFFPVIK